ncbi:MAG: hypothetical protein J6X35_05345 [Bacteroidales bacterium]|nr:hypothetical protein [Bacteroidales bacterium]
MDYVSALVCGLLSGVLSAYLVNRFRTCPKIEICEQIARDEKDVFKVKVINRSKNDAFGFLCYIIFTEPQSANKLVIRWTEIPIIRGQKYWDKEQTEIVSSVNPMAILEDKIKHLPENAHLVKQRYAEGTLSVADFLSPNGNLLMEIIISATDSKSGVNKLFVRKNLKIVKGEWKKSKNTVDSQKDNCAETN